MSDKVEKQRRGFALISPERQRQIASMGGKASSPEKRAFARDRELAARAGSKGGKSIRRVVYKSRSDML